MTTINSVLHEILDDSGMPRSVRWAMGFVLGTGLILLLRPLLVLLVPGEAFLQSEQLSWYLARASGLVGYLLITLSAVWGLLLSTRLAKALVPPPLALALHNLFSWTAIGVSVFHAGVLLFDKYYTYTIANLLIPFTGPYEPGWVGAGIIGLYTMVITSASFSFRKRMGQKNWRRLHYLTWLAYIAITFHGIKAGSDTGQFSPIYIVSGLSVLFLTIYRILTARAKA